MTEGQRYIVAGARPWNLRVFDEIIARFSGNWKFVGGPDDLTPGMILAFDPKYIFFLHWSWKVPSEIVRNYECVGFHMADLPYGRGGSPLQNLIVNGNRHTKLSALRMVEELDAGPVYLKEDLSLEGLAEEIYIRASRLSAEMIRRIIQEDIEPIPQAGEPTTFARRKPHQSEILECASLPDLFDFLRMLDADGYPKAFLTHRGFRYEFSRPALRDGRIVADVTINTIAEDPTLSL